MSLFGLPAAAGLGGLPATPGSGWPWVRWSPLAAAFWIAHARPPYQAASQAVAVRDALLATAVAVASPVIGLNLAVITTDPPVLAFMLLSLALAPSLRAATASAAPGRSSSGIALGVACDLKSTAWLAVPVMAAHVRLPATAPGPRGGSSPPWPSPPSP